MKKILEAQQQLSEFLNRWVERVTVLLVSVLLILFIIGVSTRYLFGIPIIWLYETTMVIFSWSVFLGISIAFKRSEHITMSYFFDRCSGNKGKLLSLINASLLIVFLAVVLVQSVSIVRDTASQYYHTINLSTAWFYASFPFCAVVSIIHLTSSLTDTIHDLLKREDYRKI